MSDREVSETTERAMSPLPHWAIPACRLWHRSTPQGFHLAGVWGALRVTVFPNPDRRDADDAEYILCVSPRPPIPIPTNTEETD